MEGTYGTLYYGCHVVVFILGKASAEDDIFLLCGKASVLVGKAVVLLVVDWIVRLHARFPLCAVLTADDSLRVVVDCLPEHLEMLVLYDTCVRHVTGCVVHHGVALIVRCVHLLGLETDGAEVEMPQLIVKIFVELSGVNNLRSKALESFPVGEEVGIDLRFNAF